MLNKIFRSQLGPLFALLCIVVMFAIADYKWSVGNFLSWGNIRIMANGAALIAVPAFGMTLIIIAALALGVGAGDAGRLVWLGLADARAAVGWVLIPQLVLAVGVLGLLVERLACRFAGAASDTTPRWLEPAVESALLLRLVDGSRQAH